MTEFPAFRPTLFKSFWLGGFESACQILSSGERLDMLAATQHDRFVADDYGRLATARIETVRDTIRWHLVEPTPGLFDFSSVEPLVQAARRHEIQVVWDLLHYGWPADIDIFGPEFVSRFARFAGAVARYLRARSSAVPFYTPINEMSFFAWAAGDVGMFHPRQHGQATPLKRQLVRAWIAAVDAIREVDSRARFVSAEPVIHTVPPAGESDRDRIAARERDGQWHAWDMLTGVLEPELGGAAAYLDIVGVNFYHDNQWEVPGGKRLQWNRQPRDPRWTPFGTLLEEAYARYQRPILVSETSNVGDDRAPWIHELTDEACRAIARGVPLEGICLYPIVDRFEWDNPSHWHNSGLWDVVREADGTLRRVLNERYAAELDRCQLRMAALGCGTVEPRVTSV